MPAPWSRATRSSAGSVPWPTVRTIVGWPPWSGSWSFSVSRRVPAPRSVLAAEAGSPLLELVIVDLAAGEALGQDRLTGAGRVVAPAPPSERGEEQHPEPDEEQRDEREEREPVVVVLVVVACEDQCGGHAVTSLRETRARATVAAMPV